MCAAPLIDKSSASNAAHQQLATTSSNSSKTMSDTMRLISSSNPSIMTPRLDAPAGLPAALLEHYRAAGLMAHNQAAAAAAAAAAQGGQAGGGPFGGTPSSGPGGMPPMPFFPGAFPPPPPDMKPDGLHVGGGSAQPLPGYFYDPMMAAATCPYGGGPLDLNGARRKNATRETTMALKQWLYEHRKNPYPTKGEKVMLAIITKMTLTQVSTWFANARRRLKKENKMTWSPRNRPGEDDDLGAPLDDSDGRPLSEMSDLSDETAAASSHKPAEPVLLTAHNLAQHQQHLLAQKRALPPSAATTATTPGDAAAAAAAPPAPKKPKIWSIADTVASNTDSTSVQPSLLDKSPETQQSGSSTGASTTTTTSSSSSQPFHFTFNPWQQQMAALYSAAAAQQQQQQQHQQQQQSPFGGLPPHSFRHLLLPRAPNPNTAAMPPGLYPQFNAALLAQFAAANSQPPQPLPTVETSSATVVASTTHNTTTSPQQQPAVKVEPTDSKAAAPVSPESKSD